jgi:hypothetical protein
MHLAIPARRDCRRIRGKDLPIREAGHRLPTLRVGYECRELR